MLPLSSVYELDSGTAEAAVLGAEGDAGMMQAAEAILRRENSAASRNASLCEAGSKACGCNGGVLAVIIRIVLSVPNILPQFACIRNAFSGCFREKTHNFSTENRCWFHEKQRGGIAWETPRAE
jgi:hypothetical protein